MGMSAGKKLLGKLVSVNCNNKKTVCFDAVSKASIVQYGS